MCRTADTHVSVSAISIWCVMAFLETTPTARRVFEGGISQEGRDGQTELLTSRPNSFCAELSQVLSALFARCAPSREARENSELHGSRRVTSTTAAGRWDSEPF